MKQPNFYILTAKIPELAKHDFESIDELVEILALNNRVLWPTLKFLILEHLRNYFKTQKLHFEDTDSIYEEKFLSYYSSSHENKIREQLDLTLPNRTISKTSFFIVIFSTLIWLAFMASLLFSNPEYLLFGFDIIAMNILLLIGIPYLILRFAFPRLITQEKIKGVETFEDLAEDMYGLNLWRYRENNFNRLTTELTELIQKAS
ncbi:hypothetical protein [Reichenbachiella ulvae]|uniref:Uncharacterized protein n=1 Tax=Reichenbachiella ulvae TaxID=2980104 RepID=A0ABT3CY55_9BACT|nr:hypothetical protein [Reichenbachiella ulvae]MCV9388138.1 hypothetical protein [Reichenbachiella ulvae]